MQHIASIRNLSLVRVTMEHLLARQSGLPGLACLYGPAGFGKTTALTAIGNEFRAYYIQMRSVWGRKSLLENILIEMGLATPNGKSPGSVSKMLDMATQQLSASGRPLIIDEFDHCAKSDSLVELTRDLYEMSQSPVIVVGEELLPKKLNRWERFHSRVLAWVPAAPVAAADIPELARIYCPGVTLSDAMQARLVALANGSVRRVAVNLAGIAEAAAVEGWKTVSPELWGNRPLYTGESPAARDFRKKEEVKKS
ncbi:MAG: ATP-binding protein [Zoogloeaceae bacterium]|jgi:Cdc6-like AAA superfamily ATPase|nr:ATP-binding protein [Zoogloeaceae bacterium]